MIYPRDKEMPPPTVETLDSPHAFRLTSPGKLAVDYVVAAAGPTSAEADDFRFAGQCGVARVARQPRERLAGRRHGGPLPGDRRVRQRPGVAGANAHRFHRHRRRAAARHLPAARPRVDQRSGAHLERQARETQLAQRHPGHRAAGRAAASSPSKSRRAAGPQPMRCCRTGQESCSNSSKLADN